METKINHIALIIFMLSSVACSSQSNTKEMNSDEIKNNPLLCDPETGMCEIPGQKEKDVTAPASASVDKQVRVVYFTDPICSSCWGIEPQLRKLKLEYGEHLDIEYRMGGLLPDWSYDSGGISKPSDVAHHWDDVSLHYDMPIDGDVWLEDPLNSSYPPSIAFKAAQLQSEKQAHLFLREMREMVFLKKKNIAKWEHMAVAAENVGLDVEQLKTDFEGRAKTLFEEDLKLVREYRVRGFPTLYFLKDSAPKEIVYGTKPYDAFVKAMRKIQPHLVEKEYDKDWPALFTKYQTLTAREFAELSETPRDKCETVLDELTEKEELEKLTTKNGSIWKRVN